MATASAATAQCRLLCYIHNIPHESGAAERWIRTVLESDFHVDHCQGIEGKSSVHTALYGIIIIMFQLIL